MKKLAALVTFISFSIFAILSCDTTSTDLEGTGMLQLQLQVATGNDAGKSAVNATANGEIILTDVKFFVDELELDGTNGTEDFEFEEFVVNLPLDGSPLILVEKPVPAGLYDEFELEIEKPDDDVAVNDPDLRDETGSYSFVIKGTYNGEEFRFRSGEEFEIEFDIDPPLEIVEGENHLLILEINTKNWFIDSDGSVMNPDDNSNKSRINSNIKKSFKVLKSDF
jgi:hypothetical protein